MQLNNSMGKVLQFPTRGDLGRQIQNEEERQRKVKEYQIDFCLTSSIELAYEVFDGMEARGLDLSKNKQLEIDMLMVCEAIKSAMLRSCDINHPLQAITSQIISKQEASLFKASYDQDQTEEEEDS